MVPKNHDKCFICDIRSGIKKREILFETENFYVVACAYPPKEGHLLIIYKEKHIESMAELPKDIYPELLELQNKCKHMLYEIYGKKAICCEHGSSGKKKENSSASVYDAHRHIAFIDKPIEKELIAKAEMNEISGFNDLDSDKNYVYFESTDGKKYKTNKTMEKQFLRGCIAKGTKAENDFIWQYAKPETKELFNQNCKITTGKIINYLKSCFFCHILMTNDESIFLQNKYAYARFDNAPVSKGHCLIITKRHIQTFFETTDKEKIAIFELLDKAKIVIEKKYKPDGYNIGINCGVHAGQTLMHTHVHLIPRYKGDVKNPQGGVRGIIPQKKSY